MAYERYVEFLQGKLKDYGRVRKLVESDGWELLLELAQQFEDQSESDFIEEKISAEQHRANISAVRALTGPLIMIARHGPKWVEEFEKHAPFYGKRAPRSHRGR